MSLDLADQALKRKDYKTALDAADAVIESSRGLAKAHIIKATVYHRQKKYEASLEEARLAEKASGAGDLVDCLLRIGIALIGLGRTEEAREVLTQAKKKDTENKNKLVDLWLAKASPTKVVRQGKLDVELAELTLKSESKEPKKEVETPAEPKGPKEQEPKEPKEPKKEIAQTILYTKPPRFDFFQSSKTLTVSVFMKNVRDASIDFGEQSVRIQCPNGDGSQYDYTLELAGQINASASSFKLFQTKIELSLVKATDTKWSTLTPTEPEPKKPGLGSKNWDSLEVEDDSADSDPNAFFQQVYAGADDDTRRAMMKSYIESQGTSLSTDWNEVGKGKVPVYRSSE